MVRILPPPWMGAHPAFPEYPEPLAANKVTYTAPFNGVFIGALTSTAFRIFRGRGHPLIPTFFRHTGTFALLILGEQGISQWFGWRFYIKPYLEEAGIQAGPWRLVKKSAMRTMDDYAIAGTAVSVAVGSAVALSRWRRGIPTTAPLRTLAGTMAFGAFAGQITYPWLHWDRVVEATDRHNESSDRSSGPFEHFLEYQRSRGFLGSDPVPAIPFQKMAPYAPQASPGDSSRAPGGGDGFPPLTSPHPALPPPGSEPHAVALVNGEIRPWPNTDYFWNPGSREEGIKKLKEHIQALQETRKELAQEAEYLWIVIAKKEQEYYKADDQQKKTMLRKELELLGDIHSKMFQDISGYDWMIADSKKNILQLKDDKWVPKPRSAEVQKHSPERTLKLIRNHLNNMKEVMKVTDQNLLPEDTPEDVREHFEKQQEFLKQNLNATATLMREFETYVQDGRDHAREEYLRLKAEAEKKEEGQKE